MRKRLVTVLALALLALPLTAQTSQAPGPGGGDLAMDAIPVLTVSGSGEARVDPDLATVRLGVIAQGATARAAQEQVSRAAKQGKTLGQEIERMATLGNITPDAWMQAAAGAPVSAEPLLRATAVALEAATKP